MAKLPKVNHHECRGPKMTKTPKELLHERRETKCHRFYIMSVGGQNAISVT
ncbi:hypothetical protein COLO4_08971 [Corchorus olitorius]|uniref:Uncharacterized protein n=1 Tax=Corchorus olitorius TaxID=93759 RepID=A0A1R3KDS4_9ROSI|nr:hypothetical protein COLO4_08971 [Corchorus olitorius]